MDTGQEPPQDKDTAAVERSVKAMRGHNRTLLLEAAGGKLQYRELTVQAGLHSTRLGDYLTQAGKLSPVQRAGRVQITVASVLQVFGCKAVVYSNKLSWRGLLCRGPPPQNICELWYRFCSSHVQDHFARSTRSNSSPIYFNSSIRRKKCNLSCFFYM